MASIFGHGVVGFTLAKVIDQHNAKWLIALAIFSTILPDFDVITFKFGIPYGHPMGHRGFTHSILFSILWAFVLMITFGRKNKGIWFSVIFLSTLSHGILDAMTSGGKGVGFLIPFNNSRFFFPFRGIQVSPIGIKEFFSEWGMKVLFSEFKYVFVPSFLILFVRILFFWVKKGLYGKN
ncbi:metal-dependent hydrolase [Flavivirga spongiicola]|uniref:Metal-dependent hydrolase n=1 Tax=Flavivirga spongiicola TaxID=421621 RepID=A0ABU7XV38_9FLAO|nr:metal-dependent hydrolase [Flavivirga sp. MEBiC05379]MDO5979632.1 metal-dependent hydrolase [Flavivirga sp. MEBiC05379]